MVILIHMELRHLRYFLVVAEEGSLSRAAARLHVAQPSLGRQIADLERSLSQRLFERDVRGMRMTHAAKALVVHAREIVRLADASAEIVASGVPQERITLGIGPTADDVWVLDLVRVSRAHRPDISLRVTEMLSTELMAGVNVGDLDIALTSRRPSDNLRSRLLWSEPFGVAIDPERGLADATEVDAASLQDSRILAFTRAQTPPEHDEAIREIELVSPHVRWEYSRFASATLACAIAADADAILCGAAAAARLPSSWRWMPVTGIRTRMRTWLTWRSGSSQRVRDLVDLIESLTPPRSGIHDNSFGVDAEPTGASEHATFAAG